MKKILNKKLDEKAMLAGIFAFASLGALYLFVSATVNNTQAPTIEILKDKTIATETQIAKHTVNGIKTQRSNFIKIEFNYPDKLVVKENLNFGQLVDSTGKTVIEYGKYGSLFNNARDHVYNLAKKNNLTLQNLQDLEGVYSGVTYENKVDNVDERVYLFVKDYATYYFSTKDPSFFPDLEVIAKSFKILE